jgi:hypothetical protein
MWEELLTAFSQTYFQNNLHRNTEVQQPLLSVFYFTYGLFNDAMVAQIT